MKLFFTIIIVIVLSGSIVLLLRDYYVKRKIRKLAEEKLKTFQPIIAKLTAKDSIHDAEVLALVQDPATRHALYRLLEKYDRVDLFPVEYLSHEKAAESFLVSWLEFPTELGTSPDEIRLLTKVGLADGKVEAEYFAFKFRTFPPHRSSNNNWMIGVAGPYMKDSLPYAIPRRVYSRFNEVGKVNVEDEVRWVHENIGK